MLPQPRQLLVAALSLLLISACHLGAVQSGTSLVRCVRPRGSNWPKSMGTSCWSAAVMAQRQQS